MTQNQNEWQTSGFATRAIHAGQEPDPQTGAVVVPIYQVSTYKQDGVGNLRNGYEYSRSGNPTRTAYEEALAAVEGAGDAFAFATGLAAEDVILRSVLNPGDHVLVPNDAYGGTYRLINRVHTRWGITNTPVDLSDLDAVRAALTPTTRLIWVETPTNPLLNIADIEALAAIAHEAGALLVVDNTFATPYLQQPIALGADVVVHSTTKYIGGHSDVVGGAAMIAAGAKVPGSDESVAEAIGFLANAAGAVPGPFDAWLALRGLKTLAVRVNQHCDNAERVVEFLQSHPDVTEVLYPGLASHPHHEVAAKQMRRFGGMISFRTGSKESALQVVAKTKVFALAESLGGVESLIEHPGLMTHASVAGSALEVPEDLVRVSVGIEDVDDLIEDLKQALS